MHNSSSFTNMVGLTLHQNAMDVCPQSLEGDEIVGWSTKQHQHLMINCNRSYISFQRTLLTIGLFIHEPYTFKCNMKIKRSLFGIRDQPPSPLALFSHAPFSINSIFFSSHCVVHASLIFEITKVSMLNVLC